QPAITVPMLPSFSARSSCCRRWHFFVVAIIAFIYLPIQAATARNPVIYADVPDMAMIRVGDTFYMSSTTMHLSPGLPIMKSEDLVNWQIVTYTYDTLDDVDELNLVNG